MRFRIPALLFVGLAIAAAPTYADSELTITLDSSIGYGSPTTLPPTLGFCVPPNCVLFTGEVYDNDTDDSLLFISQPYTGTAGVTEGDTDFDGILQLDYTLGPDVLSGDPDYLTDGNPPNVYDGPIFGIDIPVGTPAGAYEDTVYLDITPTNGNSPFTVSEQVTVVVTPEPAAAGLSLAGLLGLAAWFGIKRKWFWPEASR